MRKKAVALDQIPDSRPSVVDILIQEEEEARQRPERQRLRRLFKAFLKEVRTLSPAEQGDLIAYLMDRQVRHRPWPAASAEAIGGVLGRSSIWVRVRKHLARQQQPCAGTPRSCGADQPACAHERGRKICDRLRYNARKMAE